VAARAALDQARSTFETLGAIDLRRRANADLARFAARRAPGLLTRAEHDVARLVVAGRTNKEIAGELHISLRTVESNLTRIYRKMDVRSRTELTAKLISAP
jgi:DNA-binding CsgD family transcriptional regulator